MPLPGVRVTLNADGTGEVWLNDKLLPGVIAVHIDGAARGVPQVQITLRPDQVVANLPETGVQILRAGASAAEFADRLDPRRLEHDALQHLDDATQGEAFAAAVAAQAADFDTHA